MSFIQLQPGNIVNLEQIESVEITNDGGSRVVMKSGNIHEVTFKYNQFIQMVKMGHDRVDKFAQFNAS